MEHLFKNVPNRLSCTPSSETMLKRKEEKNDSLRMLIHYIYSQSFFKRNYLRKAVILACFEDGEE
jgi:hypothetical protein